MGTHDSVDRHSGKRLPIRRRVPSEGRKGCIAVQAGRPPREETPASMPDLREILRGERALTEAIDDAIPCLSVHAILDTIVVLSHEYAVRSGGTQHAASPLIERVFVGVAIADRATTDASQLGEAGST